MESLRANSYPGRIIIMGYTADRKTGVQIYSVMGRSENSRNRKFEIKDGIVRTVPVDEKKVSDPTLIIYNAMRTIDGVHIVSNGHQTDAIFDAFKKDGQFAKALAEWKEEPDAPNFTPRISGIMFSRKNSPFASSNSSMVLSEISRNGSAGQTLHEYFPYNSNILAGFGKCIHTYEGDGNPLPSFKGNPYSVLLEGPIDKMADTYWNLLNNENKVALVVKTIDLQSGLVDYRKRDKSEGK